MTATAPQPAVLTGSSVPMLAQGVRVKLDKVRRQSVLLAPERTLALDAVALAIVKEIDGERTLDAIVDDLAKTYQAPRETIADDCLAFLQQLADRRLIAVKP